MTVNVQCESRLAPQIIWRGCGSPTPTENDGSPIPKRKMNTHCASCGEPAEYNLSDAISENFTTVRNCNRSLAYGGNALCAACVFCFKALCLKAGLFFAREDGIFFIASRPIAGVPQSKPDPLTALLHPPDPPFAACFPLYGIDHGTEGNVSRILWPGAPVPDNVLTKCQSKHTAIYARVAYSKTRYPLQVDDAVDVTVNVPLWSEMRVLAEELIAELRKGGCGQEDIRTSLQTLIPPKGCPVELAARWPSRVEAFRSHAGAQWWSKVFVPMLRVPAFEPKQPKAKKSESNERAKQPRNVGGEHGLVGPQEGALLKPNKSPGTPKVSKDQPVADGIPAERPVKKGTQLGLAF